MSAGHTEVTSTATPSSTFTGKTDQLDKLPVKVEVKKLLQSRYSDNERPLSWDKRQAGVDVVETIDGKIIKLQSDGQQAPPKHGWTLVLRSGDAQTGYVWTLYGLPVGSGLPSSELI